MFDTDINYVVYVINVYQVMNITTYGYVIFDHSRNHIFTTDQT